MPITGNCSQAGLQNDSMLTRPICHHGDVRLSVRHSRVLRQNGRRNLSFLNDVAMSHGLSATAVNCVICFSTLHYIRKLLIVA